MFDRFGGPDVLEAREIADPAIAPDEALVRVRACGINHLDLWVRSGLRGLDIQMPHILGNDVVGEIAAIGSAVRHLQTGDRTLVLPTLSCGTCPQCFSGDDNLCRQYDVIGRRRNGGYAELVSVPAVNCLPYPENLRWEEAAAVPLVFLTAWHMLVGNAKLRAGQTVLVMGAGSGVGSAAIQICKMLGATVITTAGNEQKLSKARELGADYTIDHYKQKISDEAKRITNRRGVDIVFEHVGTATWNECIKSLKYGGTLVTCGATTGLSFPAKTCFSTSSNSP